LPSHPAAARLTLYKARVPMVGVITIIVGACVELTQVSTKVSVVVQCRTVTRCRTAVPAERNPERTREHECDDVVEPSPHASIVYRGKAIEHSPLRDDIVVTDNDFRAYSLLCLVFFNSSVALWTACVPASRKHPVDLIAAVTVQFCSFAANRSIWSALLSKVKRLPNSNAFDAHSAKGRTSFASGIGWGAEKSVGCLTQRNLLNGLF